MRDTAPTDETAPGPTGDRGDRLSQVDHGRSHRRDRRHGHRLRELGQAFRARIHAIPGGKMALKVTVAVVGGAIVLLGLVLVPLPGPGWAIVIGGLAIWAIEFVWAQHLLRYLRRKLTEWTHWVTRLPRTARFGLGTLIVLAGITIGWQWIENRYGFETVAEFWRYIWTH